MQKNIFSTGTRGFTLIEILVAVFMISIIFTMVGSVFVSSLDLQRRAVNLQQTEENASYVLESMAKEIRVSQITSVDGCSSSLAITNQYGEQVVYSQNGTDILRTVNGTQTRINSNTVQFTRLGFCVAGAATGDQKQPRVTITARMQSKNFRQQSMLDIQTTLSLRGLSN